MIRKGLDVDNIHLALFYPKPTAADSEESHRLYNLNQFSITRQQTFSNMRPGLELENRVYWHKNFFYNMLSRNGI